MYLTRHAHARFLTCLAACLAGACLLAALVAPSADAAFGLKDKWGTNGGVGGLGLAEGEMIEPMGIAQGPSGEIFQAEAKDCSIRVYSAAGAPLRSWGGICDGASPTGLSSPTTIAVDMNGHVYVADTNMSRIQIYDSNGIWLRTIGGNSGGGTVGGRLMIPYGVAVTPLSATPDVYVSDSSNYRIQKFDSTGAFVWASGFDVDSTNGSAGVEICTVAPNCQAGTSTAVAGGFAYPVGIAIAGAAGPLVVTDTSNNRVQKFSPSGGTPTSSFPTTNPWALTLAPNGDAWVAEGGSQTATVRRYDAAGTLQTTVGSGTPSPAADGLGQPFGLSATTSGGVLIADFVMHRISEFTQAGAPVRRIGKNGGPGWARSSASGSFSFPRDVTVYGSKVWVADSDNNRIQNFGLDGSSPSGFGSTGSQGKQFQFPTAVAVDNDEVWVADGFNHRIQKFNAAGDFQAAFGWDVSISNPGTGFEVCTVASDCKTGVSGTGSRQFNFPVDLAISPLPTDGNLYVVEQNNHRIQVFDRSTFALVDTVGGVVGSANGQFQNPQSISFLPNGYFWVADSSNYRMQKFTDSRGFNQKFTTFNGIYGAFPSAAAVVGNELHVSEGQNHRIAVYDITNPAVVPTLSRTYGAIGSNSGEFYQNTQVAAGTGGDVYVADSGNGRIQRFGDVTAPPAPTVNITSPLGGTTVYNQSTIELVYTATNSAGENLTCNPLSHSQVPIAVGSHAITVTCVNPLGGTITDSVTVERIDDTEDPLIDIISPTAGQNFTSASVAVDYDVSDNTDPSPNCIPADGSNVTLTSGANAIQISCTDAAGNVGTAVVNVTYTPPSGSVPADPDPTPIDQPQPPLVPAPTLALKLAKTLKFKGAIPVDIKCDLDCTYALSAKVKVGKQTYVAGITGGAVAGIVVACRVKFTPKETKAIKATLKTGKKLSVKLTFDATSSSGAKAGKSGSVKMSK